MGRAAYKVVFEDILNMKWLKSRSLLAGSRGFTLIELIIAIAILAIMTSVVLLVVDPFSQFKKSLDTSRKSDLAQIQRALEQYYQDYGKYPANNASYQMIVMIGGSPTSLLWGSAWDPYMEKLPKEPVTTKRYVYVASADQQSYWIYASLDRGGKDPQACNSGGTSCPNVPNNGAVVCGTASDYCNYGVSSPNQSP